MREAIKQVREQLGISESRQIIEAWGEQYKFVYLPLIKAKSSRQARERMGQAYEVSAS